MVELHERFADGLFEEKSEKLKFHRGENKQSRRTEEQKGEADKVNQIRIELLNMPVFAVEMSGSKHVEKQDTKNLDISSGFLDIIEMILEMIVEGVKAIFPKREEKN
jgi:hypothetical protein